MQTVSVATVTARAPAAARIEPPKPAPRVWLNRADCAVAALLALVVTALHVRFATNVGALWRDEVNSVNLATVHSLGEMWRLLDYDSFPLLFFGVLRGWTGIFGAQNDLALRVLGFITGLGVLAALWANARAFGVRWPVLSFALVGLNPMLIRYGDSTRAYGLGILLILLTLRSFWRLVDSPAPPGARRIFSAALFALLSVQCLYYNSALLLAIAAGASAVAWRQRAWRTIAIVLGIGLVSAASLLPYVPMMQRMREWTFLVSHPADFLWLWQRLCDVIGAPSSIGVWLWPGLLLVSLATVVTLWLRERETVPPAVLFTAVTLAVGVVAYALFLRALSYVTQPWYYITLAAFAACALEVLFAAWPKNSKAGLAFRVARLTVALLLLGTASWPDWKMLPSRLTNLDLVAAHLREIATKDDLVIVALWECAIPLERYYSGPAQVMTLPPIADHRMHRYDLFLHAMTVPDALAPVRARMTEVLRSGRRVFLVGYVPFPKADFNLPPAPPPAYRDAEGLWHGGAYRVQWQIETGHFLRHKGLRAAEIVVPVPDDLPVLEYENLDLRVVEGWRDGLTSR